MKIEFNDTADIEITHPVHGTVLLDSENNPMTIKVYGAQSEQFRKAKNRQVDARLKNKKGPASLTGAQVDEEACAMLAELTVSFNNFDMGDGVPDIDAAKYLYLSTPWLKAQIDEAIGDNANFLKEG